MNNFGTLEQCFQGVWDEINVNGNSKGCDPNPTYFTYWTNGAGASCKCVKSGASQISASTGWAVYDYAGCL